MLTSLRIQNFRSIRDASVKLGKVNLFIGPNNSGKSNFLKGIELVANRLHSKLPSYSESEFDQIITREVSTHTEYPARSGVAGRFEIEFTPQFNFKQPDIISQITIRLDRTGQATASAPHHVADEATSIWANLSDVEQQELLSRTQNLFETLFTDIVVYKPDPAKFIKSTVLAFIENLDADGQNIANFLFNLSQNHKKLYQQLEEDFRQCVGSLNQVATPADPTDKGTLRLKFFDAQGNAYWAEEVSEGVLYFLALLCIVHQPNPPKLLLLEEPEKGIHPRRIKEVIDFILELARLRDIQIILTSHSPYVVDHFADTPECISVFDRDPQTGETLINNAGDIISETNEKLVSEGKKPIHYSDALGEYWVSGFLGGVPV